MTAEERAGQRVAGMQKGLAPSAAVSQVLTVRISEEVMQSVTVAVQQMPLHVAALDG